MAWIQQMNQMVKDQLAQSHQIQAAGYGNSQSIFDEVVVDTQLQHPQYLQTTKFIEIL